MRRSSGFEFVYAPPRPPSAAPMSRASSDLAICIGASIGRRGSGAAARGPGATLRLVKRVLPTQDPWNADAPPRATAPRAADESRTFATEGRRQIKKILERCINSGLKHRDRKEDLYDCLHWICLGSNASSKGWPGVRVNFSP